MPHKKRKGSKSKSKKSSSSKQISLKQRPASLSYKRATPIEYTGPRVYSAPQKYITNSEKFVTNPALPYVRPTTPELPHEELLTDFLSKCSPGSSGSYVNQGTYGVGLKYQITQSGVASPFEYLTLSHLASNIMPDNSNIFVKFVPLTEPPPADEFISEFNKSIPSQRCKYVDDEGDIVSGKLATPRSDWTENVNLNINSIVVKYEDFRGFAWSIECDNNVISSTYIGQFLEECTSQVDMFKSTNNDLDSFIIPIYESLVITQDEIHIIEQLKDCYDFSAPNNVLNTNFFDRIIFKLRESKYFKMGIIVMPMMPFPPIVNGWNYLRRNNCYQNGYREFTIRNITKFMGDNFYIFKHTDTNHLIDNIRYSLLFLSQLISHMITLLEHGFIHGDVHPGNTLIHPELSNTSDGIRSPSYRGKLFLIDFGTVIKDGLWIQWASEDNDYKRFKLQIKTLLVSRGTHGFSPLEYSSYDWLPALFLKRDNRNKYILLNVYSAQDLANEDIIIYDDDENGISPYFIEENLRTMYDWINEYKRGNREFIEGSASIMETHKEMFDRIRAFNKSGNTRSTMRGGGDKDIMNRMIENLEYGEQTLNALRKEYSDAVNLMHKKPKSAKRSNIMKRSKKPKRNKTKKTHSKVSKKTIRQSTRNKTAKHWRY